VRGTIAGKNTNAKDAKTSPILPHGQASRLSMRKGRMARGGRARL